MSSGGRPDGATHRSQLGGERGEVSPGSLDLEGHGTDDVHDAGRPDRAVGFPHLRQPNRRPVEGAIEFCHQPFGDVPQGFDRGVSSGPPQSG